MHKNMKNEINKEINTDFLWKKTRTILKFPFSLTPNQYEFQQLHTQKIIYNDQSKQESQNN